MNETSTLVRGLSILRLFADSPTLSQTEISQRLGLSLPTVHRLCRTLMSQEFLTRDLPSKRLRLGREVVRLAQPALERLADPDRYREVIRSLARETGETCNLATLAGDEVVYLDTEVPGTRLLRPRVTLGMRAPSYCTALGKALLAGLTDAQVGELLGPGPYEQRTPHTITTLADLLADLAAVRRQGYAVSREEYERGLSAVAVAVPGDDPRWSLAVSVSVPTVRADDAALAAIVERLVSLRRSLPAWA